MTQLLHCMLQRLFLFLFETTQNKLIGCVRMKNCYNYEHLVCFIDPFLQIFDEKVTWETQARIGSLANTKYKPTGGDVRIEQHKLDFKEKAKARIGSLDKAAHTPGGGDVKIEQNKLDFKGGCVGCLSVLLIKNKILNNSYPRIQSSVCLVGIYK